MFCKSVKVKCPNQNCPYKDTFCWFDHSTEPQKTLPKKRKLQPQVHAAESSPSSPVLESVQSIPAQKPVRMAPKPLIQKKNISQVSHGSRPIVSASLNSVVERVKRQKILDLFFDQFSRIYEPIQTQLPNIAAEHAILQESNLLQKCSKSSMYTTLAMPIINRLKKRPTANSVTDVGVDGVWKEIVVQENPKYASFKKLCITKTEQLLNGYPLLESVSKSSEEKDSDDVSCDRCGATFTPKLLLSDADMTACTYHELRPRYVNPSVSFHVSQGPKVREYACCNKDHGCKKGPHVYKQQSLYTLNKLKEFWQLNSGEFGKRVVSIDCEMSYTTCGMEVTRVSIIEFDTTILDVFVKPVFPIVDLNTRWSGVSDLSDAITFSSLCDEIKKILSKETVIIGHGLENDLIALRLFHENVIDTSILYPKPHIAGSKFVQKYSLKYLTEMELGKKIQEDSQGHDSVEDARASLDLVLAYMRRPVN